nr:40s ribosomal protein s7 [Quercus suber]
MAALLLSSHTISLSQPNLCFPRRTKKARAVLNRTQKMQVPYELKQGQTRLFHKLPSGLNMEVIVQKGVVDKDPYDRNSENPPLVFVHGSYHAAWCWAEHWLPFFSACGFDCYALSLLGQGESDAPSGSVAGTLQTHASDVADFIQKKVLLPPVLLGHSFGGLIIQYYIANVKNNQAIEMESFYPKLTGAALVCSVPPSGNSGLVWRYLFSKPIAAFKITRSLAAKAFQTSLPLCKETFFSSTMEDQLVLRYQELMRESSRMPLFDLRKLNASLPVPSIPKGSVELLVLGANDDFIVDAEGLRETGRFYGVSPVNVERVAHDMMLDCSWEKGRAPYKTLQYTFSSSSVSLPKSRVFTLSAQHSLASQDSAFTSRSAKMYSSRKKIQKDKDVEPTEFEDTVAQYLFDLENTNQELKSDLKDLYINSAAQMDVSGNRKAVVVYVPFRLRKAFRKIHLRLVRELEKKFSGKDVVLIASRRIVRPPKKGSAAQRPRTRTLTSVHENMLEDIVHPAEIVGKRIRYRIDGSKIMKVYLDPKERNNTEYKLETFAGVYRKLTGKDVVFEYPIAEA